jgi:hypothetical protein
MGESCASFLSRKVSWLTLPSWVTLPGPSELLISSGDCAPSTASEQDSIRHDGRLSDLDATSRTNSASSFRSELLRDHHPTSNAKVQDPDPLLLRIHGNFGSMKMALKLTLMLIMYSSYRPNAYQSSQYSSYRLSSISFLCYYICSSQALIACSYMLYAICYRLSFTLIACSYLTM